MTVIVPHQRQLTWWGTSPNGHTKSLLRWWSLFLTRDNSPDEVPVLMDTQSPYSGDHHVPHQRKLTWWGTSPSVQTKFLIRWLFCPSAETTHLMRNQSKGHTKSLLRWWSLSLTTDNLPDEVPVLMNTQSPYSGDGHCPSPETPHWWGTSPNGHTKS